ncbi:MAG: hypothetical protein HY905_19280 [Deltaproteobacteria bacterium]|nr:hypothetical protein [Deltaproteobacteria bacterium]
MPLPTAWRRHSHRERTTSGRGSDDAAGGETAAFGAVPDVDVVYACSGVRALALDRTTGDERWNWSVGGCEILGIAGETLLVRFSSAGPSVTSADLVWEGVLGFRRGASAVPCEEAEVRDVVRVNGIAAPGLHVRAGEAWSASSDGTVTGWGTRVPPMPDGRSPSDVAVTDDEGGYLLHFCDRGHVPVVVDAEESARFAGETHADGGMTYIHLDGSGIYPLDFEISAHGPEL